MDSAEHKKYLFVSERLGFRNWTKNDLPEFAAMNADPAVMEHFPRPLTHEESADFIDRLLKHFEDRGYNYFATEVLATGELIGFIGLAYQQYEADFTPATDIGWRLKRSAWGKGYASEGAQRCLDHAFNDLGLDKIISTCPLVNDRSENVMKKLGMKRVFEFNHPRLGDFPKLQRCVCYEIERDRS